jgi:hypothetical protein
MQDVVKKLEEAVSLVETELEKSAALADLKNQLNTLKDTVSELVAKDAAADVPAEPATSDQPAVGSQAEG